MASFHRAATRVSLAVVAILGASGPGAFAAVLNPPNPLTLDEVGNTNHGIQFTALDNSTLESFIYNYQGDADTVELTTVGAGTVLDMIAIPSGSDPGTFTASVDWALVSGSTYWLIGTTTSNGMLGAESFPVSDADISVTAGVFSSSPTSSFWGDFTAITTESSVPEEALAVPVLATLAGMWLAKRHPGAH